MLTVRPAYPFLRNSDSSFFVLASVACASSINVSISFGGKSWPIDPVDMNLGSVGSGLCLGGIFDLNLGSSVSAGGGNPSWVVGDTFLVSPEIPICFFVHPLPAGRLRCFCFRRSFAFERYL